MVTLYLETSAIFAGCLIAQIILWRALKRPDDVVPFQIVLLFFLFLGIPAIYSVIAFPSVDRLVLSLALGAAYIMTFPAASAKSPTIMIYYLLHKHKGLTPEELKTKLAAEMDLKGDRMKDLSADGLYSSSGRPSAAGRILGYVFWSYRKLLDMPVGEG